MVLAGVILVLGLALTALARSTRPADAHEVRRVLALREKVGEFSFSRIIRDWAAQNRYGNVTTPQFVALAQKISGLNLANFFDVWLYQEGKPTSW